MGLDASLRKYNTTSISKKSRKNHVYWRTKTYQTEHKSDWDEFEQNIYYTDDRLFNTMILGCIEETTGDDFVEEGGSLVTKETLELVVKSLNESLIDNSKYPMESKKLCKQYIKEISSILESEKDCFDKYTYIYHATY